MCPTCNDPVTTKMGKPLTMGLFSGGNHPLIIKCARCTKPFKLTPGVFNLMPEVSVVK